MEKDGCLIRAILNGSRCVRKAGSLYLPRFPGEDFAARLIFNASRPSRGHTLSILIARGSSYGETLTLDPQIFIRGVRERPQPTADAYRS